MNNDLEQFSEERPKEIAEMCESKALGFPASHAESAALARIALSAKQAKPVAWLTWHQGFRAPDDCEDYLNAYTYKTEEKSVDGSDACPVYTTPQPAHTEQVIPDGWKLVPVEPTEKMKAAAEGEYSLKLAYKAMLRAAPKPESE